MIPADIVERFGLPLPVAGGPVADKGLLGLVGGPVGPAPPLPQDAEGAVEGLPEVGVGVVVVAEQAAGPGEAAMGERGRAAVADAVGGGQRGPP